MLRKRKGALLFIEPRAGMQKGKKREGEGERDKFDAFLTLTSVLTLRIAVLKVFKIVHVFKYM